MYKRQGLSLFTSVEKKDVLKKIVKHPCIIAVVIGVLFMAFNVHLPIFLDNTIGYISKCTTAVSMIIIGSILTETNRNNILSKEVFYYSFLRLIVMPVIVLFILKALNFDPMPVSYTHLDVYKRQAWGTSAAPKYVRVDLLVLTAIQPK